MSTRHSAASQNVQADVSHFAADVEYYLTLEPRQLPSRYLYDPLGSALFEAICELPWYRVTKTELALLESSGRAILDRAAPGTSPLRIVELGPGSGAKLRTLIDAGRHGGRPLDLHLIDVSATALEQATRMLADRDDVQIETHQARYEAGLHALTETDVRTLVLFLGSNIGNFDPPGAEAFLRSVRAALHPGDALLLGADLVKPECELLLAYDDPLGVTAAFNRNLLVRINRELGGDFDLDAFGHRAIWSAEQSRVEMHLVSRRRQRVRISGARIDITLADGETIWTESSYKYEPEELAALLERAGFQAIERWPAPSRYLLTLARAK